MSVVLVRHTSIVVPKGLCYGRIDVPLAATFAREAASTRARLPWAPEAVMSSPAERCRRLAAELTPAGVAVVIDARLAELSMGAWEGRLWEDLRGYEVDRWMADPWRERPPGGETTDEFLARVGAVRAELAVDPRRRLVVTHAGVIRAWRSLDERRKLAELMSEQVPFGSLWPAGIGRDLG